MATTYWTRTTFALSVVFWILQFTAVISHISIITIWIGFLGAKTNVERIPYIYATLLITAVFLLGSLFSEVFFQASSTLSLARYNKLQILKIRISLIEMLALAIISHGIEDSTGVVWKTVLATGCMGLPFNFSRGLAAFIMRRERKREELEGRKVDEETPLLEGR